jgi:hypothetical protein
MIDAILIHAEQPESIGFVGWSSGALVLVTLLGMLAYPNGKRWDELETYERHLSYMLGYIAVIVGALYLGYFLGLVGSPVGKWLAYAAGAAAVVGVVHSDREMKRWRPPCCDKCHEETTCENCGWTAPPEGS